MEHPEVFKIGDKVRVRGGRVGATREVSGRLIRDGLPFYTLSGWRGLLFPAEDLERVPDEQPASVAEAMRAANSRVGLIRPAGAPDPLAEVEAELLALRKRLQAIRQTARKRGPWLYTAADHISVALAYLREGRI